MYIISACLAGINCRYDGKNSGIVELEKLVKDGKAIALCPEVLGGLSIPRVSCEIILDDKGQKRVKTKDGNDVTDRFIDGAQKTLDIARILGTKVAILKSKSPSCGIGQVYDGTFSGNLIEGNGFTAELLIKNGVEVYSENNFINIKNK